MRLLLTLAITLLPAVGQSDEIASMKRERDRIVSQFMADAGITLPLSETFIQQALDAGYCAGVLDAAGTTLAESRGGRLAYSNVGDDVFDKGASERVKLYGYGVFAPPIEAAKIERQIAAREWTDRPADELHREAILCAFPQERVPSSSVGIGADAKEARYNILFAAALGLLFGAPSAE